MAQLGLTGIPASDVADGVQAVEPASVSGGITGVVWRDFKPGGGGTAGQVEEGEVGIPGVTLQLTDSSGGEVATATSEADGVFTFSGLSEGNYTVGISSQTFQQPFAGVNWLGPQLITPSIIIAYIWVWAGFSMVLIAAGLAAIPRDVLEAARTDGATEWQVFRRVTVPLLAPVLSVVFITMIINVLKVFDIILSVAPASVQDDANVDRPGDVAHVVRRRQRLRPGLRDRRVPVPARDPGAAAQRASFQKGGVMATVAGHAEVPLIEPVDRRGGRSDTASSVPWHTHRSRSCSSSSAWRGWCRRWPCS